MVLTKLKQVAEAFLGETVNDAVISPWLRVGATGYFGWGRPVSR